MNIRRSFSLVLTFILVVVSAPLFANAEEQKRFCRFDDTRSNAVVSLCLRKVVDETPSFFPEELVTRADFFTWALRNVGFFSTTPGEEPFSDVDPRDQFAPYVAKALELGMIETGLKFFPEENVRVDHALRVLLMTEDIPATPRISGEDFSDLPDDQALANAVLMAVETGIWNPKSKSELGVNTYLTREKAAEITKETRFANIRYRNKDKGKLRIGTGSTSVQSRDSKQEVLEEMLKLIEKNYLYKDNFTEEELLEAAIKGMLEHLEDQNTTYLPGQEAEDFENKKAGKLEGIGAQIGKNEGDEEEYVEIRRIYPETPAEKSGLQVGDMIIGIDGTDVIDQTPEQIAAQIRGAEGTSVDVTVLRGEQEFTFSIIRKKIELQYAYLRREGEFLQIEITNFEDKTRDQLQKILETKIEKKTRGIIIDLRKNPGGSLRTVLELLGYFLPPQSVAMTETQIDLQTKRDVIAPRGFSYTKLPLVVLVDERSASASEIFAGAIQDHKRGMVIGKPTFGKGTGQSIVRFSDSSVFKYTTLAWGTPSGKSIDGVGITPDILVEDDAKVLETARRILKTRRAKWFDEDKALKF